jgi:predicted DNA-binding transcriptional regulator AlpA
MNTLSDPNLATLKPKKNLKPIRPKGLMNLSDLQEYLSMSYDQIYRLRGEDPEFKVVRIRGRLYAKQEDIDAWIEKQYANQIYTHK